MIKRFERSLTPVMSRTRKSWVLGQQLGCLRMRVGWERDPSLGRSNEKSTLAARLLRLSALAFTPRYPSGRWHTPDTLPLVTCRIHGAYSEHHTYEAFSMGSCLMNILSISEDDPTEWKTQVMRAMLKIKDQVRPHSPNL